jgi:hypothetical protein
LPLIASNRLNGTEIGRLLTGSKIEGKFFYYTPRWQRAESGDGKVTYTGFAIQTGVPLNAIGTSRIEDDMICERWTQTPEPLELCSVIFRVPDGNLRSRWGDYVMVTDRGPQSFRLVE